METGLTKIEANHKYMDIPENRGGSRSYWIKAKDDTAAGNISPVRLYRENVPQMKEIK
jgi:hypothetical protein